MKAAFDKECKDWTDKTKRELKLLVSDLVSESTSEVLIEHDKNFIQKLVKDLESMIEQKSKN